MVVSVSRAGSSTSSIIALLKIQSSVEAEDGIPFDL